MRFFLDLILLFFLQDHLIHPEVSVENIDIDFLGASSAQLLLTVYSVKLLQDLLVHLHLIDFSLDQGV